MLTKIQRVLAHGIRGLYARWSSSVKLVRPVSVVLLSLFLEGCTRPSVQEPVTLTFLEEWSNRTFSEARQQELQQFTRETGIRVSLLPSPGLLSCCPLVRFSVSMTRWVSFSSLIRATPLIVPLVPNLQKNNAMEQNSCCAIALPSCRPITCS